MEHRSSEEKGSEGKRDEYLKRTQCHKRTLSFQNFIKGWLCTQENSNLHFLLFSPPPVLLLQNSPLSGPGTYVTYPDSTRTNHFYILHWASVHPLEHHFTKKTCINHATHPFPKTETSVSTERQDSKRKIQSMLSRTIRSTMSRTNIEIDYIASQKMLQ